MQLLTPTVKKHSIDISAPTSNPISLPNGYKECSYQIRTVEDRRSNAPERIQRRQVLPHHGQVEVAPPTSSLSIISSSVTKWMD